jgi:hypothetical protein
MVLQYLVLSQYPFDLKDINGRRSNNHAVTFVTDAPFKVSFLFSITVCFRMQLLLVCYAVSISIKIGSKVA